jgi:hypothetical protein
MRSSISLRKNSAAQRNTCFKKTPISVADFPDAGLSRYGSTGPIARPSLLMCYRHDDDLILSGSIEDVERKSLKNELACAVIGKWEGVWSFSNS